ncbi:histone methyltransferase set2 [Taxawa tesnikishii (nom. ined.)]|nr:histone methyltransferase set2 [Dothideales sp. JES 119]
MSDNGDVKNPVGLEADVKEMKIEEDDTDKGLAQGFPQAMPDQEERTASGSEDDARRKSKRNTETPVKSQSAVQSPIVKSEQEEVIGGDITVKLEPGKAPKLSRSQSQKIIARPPQLFAHLPDATEEAKATFDVLPDCTYAAKHLGSTDPALECDCSEEWDAATKTNYACGEDSDCINRATKMECLGDCGCGTGCQNQRFQLKQYANVTVIKTEKKGYGLRADSDLKPNDFIFEYIGEVINENTFRRRMHQYDQEGIKHFYFMSLSKGEFVDATKKGNLGRFCNHSCNPNCYVDKWVVGDKLRMGIFAERKIQAGEELVFNYNVDRYGADPQPCYCGEPNCTGFIGGKTQTERATKLSNATIEALGIEDGEDWDTAVAKKPRKRKTGEDDEEYVNNVTPKGLDEGGVTKVMATLAQCKEKWIAVKLLNRLQRAEDEKVRTRVVKMHGYRILNTALNTWVEDVNVTLQIFDILNNLPRITRNKIQDSKIEETVQKLTENEDERVKTQASNLLEIWSKLEVAYRIPRIKRDPNATEIGHDPGLGRDQLPDLQPRLVHAVTFLKGIMDLVRPTDPARRHRQLACLPGETYTTCHGCAPPPPPKAISDQQRLNDLIANIVANKDASKEKASASATPVDTPKKETKEDKWRSLPEEKQKKLYEHTLQPSIMYVMGRFKGKLDREDLKRFGKDIAKKLVASDFKNNRVEDPTKIDSKKERAVKKYVKEFFDKAVVKKREHDRKRAEKEKVAKKAAGSTTPLGSPPQADGSPMDLDNTQDEVVLSDMEDDDDKPPTSATDEVESPASLLKRKREEDAAGTGTADDMHGGQMPEAGLTPNEDVSGSFTNEALEAVAHGSVAHQSNGDGNGAAYQIATPPTTGSPHHSEEDKEKRKRDFAGLNPDRMRALGLLDEDGAS